MWRRFSSSSISFGFFYSSTLPLNREDRTMLLRNLEKRMMKLEVKKNTNNKIKRMCGTNGKRKKENRKTRKNMFISFLVFFSHHFSSPTFTFFLSSSAYFFLSILALPIFFLPLFSFFHLVFSSILVYCIFYFPRSCDGLNTRLNHPFHTHCLLTLFLQLLFTVFWFLFFSCCYPPFEF